MSTASIRPVLLDPTRAPSRAPPRRGRRPGWRTAARPADAPGKLSVWSPPCTSPWLEISSRLCAIEAPISRHSRRRAVRHAASGARKVAVRQRETPQLHRRRRRRRGRLGRGARESRVERRVWLRAPMTRAGIYTQSGTRCAHANRLARPPPSPALLALAAAADRRLRRPRGKERRRPRRQSNPLFRRRGERHPGVQGEHGGPDRAVRLLPDQRGGLLARRPELKKLRAASRGSPTSSRRSVVRMARRAGVPRALRPS